MSAVATQNAFFSSSRGLGVTASGKTHSCSYANLPECVAQAASEGKMFLVFNGFINVREAQKEIGLVHTYLAKAEQQLTSAREISRDWVNDSGAGFWIKEAGWNWRRYLEHLNICDNPEHHPELPTFLKNHAWAMEYWVAGIQDVPTIRELW